MCARATFEPQRDHARLERSHPKHERGPSNIKLVKQTIFIFGRDSNRGPSMTHFTPVARALTAPLLRCVGAGRYGWAVGLEIAENFVPRCRYHLMFEIKSWERTAF